MVGFEAKMHQGVFEGERAVSQSLLPPHRAWGLASGVQVW